MDVCEAQLANSSLVMYVTNDNIPTFKNAEVCSVKNLDKIRCSECERAYSNRSNLLRHLRAHHKVDTSTLLLKASRRQSASLSSSSSSTSSYEILIEGSSPMDHFMGSLLETPAAQPKANEPEVTSTTIAYEPVTDYEEGEDEAEDDDDDDDDEPQPKQARCRGAHTKLYPHIANDPTEGLASCDLFNLDYLRATEKSFIEYTKQCNWKESVDELVSNFNSQYPAINENATKSAYLFCKNRAMPEQGLEYSRFPTHELAALLKTELQCVPRLEVINYISCVLNYYIQVMSTSLILASMRMGKRLVTDSVYHATVPFIQDLKMSTLELVMCTNYTHSVNLNKNRIDFIIRRGLLALAESPTSGFGKLVSIIELHEDFRCIIRLYTIQFLKTLCSIVHDYDLNKMNIVDIQSVLNSERNRFKLKTFTKFTMQEEEYAYETEYDDE